MRVDIRIAGSGGQGLQWMANAIVLAAVEFSDLHAAQSASYGSATRGGYSRGDVVVCDYPVDYPWLMSADFLVCRDQRAFDTDICALKPEGTLLVESAIVRPDDAYQSRVLSIPAIEMAEKAAGDAKYGGPVILGVMDSLIHWLRPGALEKAVETLSPPKAKEENMLAFAVGSEHGALLPEESL
ncbi:MAG: 2-oxoacid:acceptor oxidoreductase family protein [Dehalococcoidia bacterium]